MIRVLHSVSNMDRAGIETMVMNFYRHMDRSVVQFLFLANKTKPGAYEDEIAEMGGRVFRSPGYYPQRFPAYLRLVRDIQREYPDMNIIHVHNGALGAYALLAAKLCGIAHRVYHAHGTRLPGGKGAVMKRICKPMIDPLATTKLACGTKAAKFYYTKKTIARGDYQLIHNAIELDRFAYNPEARAQKRAELGLTDSVVIGHVGRFSVEKNHARMLPIIAAVRKVIPNAVMLMIGEGENWDAVEAQIKAMGLTDAVRMIPSVSDTWNWYQAMDLFLLPSIWEGLPVVAIEAQAAGLPCILSDSVTEEAKVTDRVRFVSLSDGDDAWARAIQASLAEQKPRDDTKEALRAAGYDIVLEAKKLQDLYVSLARG